jgi:hypothetical protein
MLLNIEAGAQSGYPMLRKRKRKLERAIALQDVGCVCPTIAFRRM